MRRESARFCSGVCLASACRVSRSIPEQKAFPAPVRITTRTDLSASAALSAATRSSIIGVEMALRLSGRFRVSVATWPSRSNFSVLYSKMASVLVHCGRGYGRNGFLHVDILLAQFFRHGAGDGERLGINSGGNASRG